MSAVEIAFKHELGQLTLPAPPAMWVPASRVRLQMQSLPLDEEAALRMASLPRLHRDPFDRMLICQALESGLTLVTPDPMIRQDVVPTLW